MRLSLPLTLQTRVGRRIALMFVLSALVPVAVMAVEGYWQVRVQLMDLAAAQLRQAAENVGQGILDQLTSAENTLLDAAGEIGVDGSPPRTGANPGRSARTMFASFAIVDAAGTRALWGQSPRSELTPREMRWLRDGHRLLRIAGVVPQLWMVTGGEGEAQIWAAINSSYLFSGAAERSRTGPGDSWLCIRAVGTTTPLLCPARSASTPELSARWDLFLGGHFGALPWRIEVAQPLADVYRPEETFRRTFLLSIVTVLGLVVLLTSVQVRRSLQPLTELGEGTRRLAQRDFSGTVSVSSGDEFEDLASSFNRMAGEIDQQFRTLTAVNAIDQVALTSRRAWDMASTAAERLVDAVDCESVAVYVAGEREEDAWRCVRASGGAVVDEGVVQPSGRDLDQLRAGRHGWWYSGGDGFDWLGPSGKGAAALFPLVSHDELVGLIAVHGDGSVPEERLRSARQLGDQLALGLSNSGLIVRLNGLSYGALSALARTIDANSAWTAGHSERVTSLSLRIGRHLCLPAPDMDTLHRGGLLHDIGKVGVHSEILDFDGRLTPEERAQMEQHPTVGARILAPIAAFAEAIPIVLHHHERFDGTGYPQGLSGEGIHFLARLIAVADVYDALVSGRPYRPAWEQTRAIEHIRAGAGTHFDPNMVEAFLAVMESEGDWARFVPTPLEPTELPR